MALVQRLVDTLINQIAAGEVVERPASVAKELCENALDAGAKSISVEISEGGMRRILVVDDGCGMSFEDAKTCLERHATSKLREEDGLRNIGTLGFRGEAIPAIASVSKFTLTTRLNPGARRVPTSWETAHRLKKPIEEVADSLDCLAEEIGTRLQVEGGNVVSVEEVGAPGGTRIEVCDLFFNTPARRKFLKRPATESSNTIETICRLALARPEVAFRLISNGKEVFSSPACRDRKERLSIALGPEAVRHLIDVEFTRGHVRVHGHITDPDHTLSTAKGIYTYVNGRYVRDRSLTAVIQRAYRDVTEPGRSPACVLFIEVPLADVDINVHPQKLEVRFADAQAVTGCLFRAVQEALRQSPWLQGQGHSSRHIQEEIWGVPPSVHEGNADFQNAPSPVVLREEPSPDQVYRRANAPVPDENPGSPAVGSIHHTYEDIQLPFRPRPGVAFSGLKAPGGALAGGDEISAGERGATNSENRPVAEGYFHSLRIIGQFAATYIVCEAPGPKLVVIDQHAAHERIRFHTLREAFRKKSPVVQPFLMPLTLELSPSDAALLEDHREELLQIGYDVEPFGGGTVALKAVPQVMVGCDHRKMLADLASEFMQVGRTKAFDEAMDHALATMACHSAIRAHELRSEAELRAVLDALDGIDFSTRCPHGRPIAAQVSIAELEREVARR